MINDRTAFSLLHAMGLLAFLANPAAAQTPPAQPTPGPANASPLSPVPTAPASALPPVAPASGQAAKPAAPSSPAQNGAASPAAATMPGAAPTAPPSAGAPQPGAQPGTEAAPKPPPAKAAKPKPKPPIREWALSPDPTPSFQPETFFATSNAADRYAKIVAAGGWPVVPGEVKPGAPGPAVAALRQRLAVEGDLPEALARGEKWDPVLASAVKRFQERNGLKETGIVTGATLRAINVPAQIRHGQLAASAQRLAGIEFPFGDRYVVVNIPSASVETVQDGVVARRYVAVVGDPGHRSPEVQAKVQVINLNPTWTVPTSIIKNEIIPKMRKDPGWLAKSRIRILDGKNQEIDPSRIDWKGEKAVNYTLRQDPGPHNSLGSIRIGMPNKHAVYMHDTPAKSFFGQSHRFLSHGCVRVQGVYELAAWLLKETPNPSGAAWDALGLKSVEAREDVKLTRPVPVIWVYMTGWASADGTVHFADDVYGVDAPAQQASLR